MFERRIWVRVLRIVSVVFMEAFEKHSTAQHSTARTQVWVLWIEYCRLQIVYPPLTVVPPYNITTVSQFLVGIDRPWKQYRTKYEV